MGKNLIFLELPEICGIVHFLPQVWPVFENGLWHYHSILHIPIVPLDFDKLQFFTLILILRLLLLLNTLIVSFRILFLQCFLLMFELLLRLLLVPESNNFLTIIASVTLPFLLNLIAELQIVFHFLLGIFGFLEYGNNSKGWGDRSPCFLFPVFDCYCSQLVTPPIYLPFQPCFY